MAFGPVGAAELDLLFELERSGASDRGFEVPFCELTTAAALTSFWRFSRASRSRSALERNFGLLAAASASLLFRKSSSTLRGFVLGFDGPRGLLGADEDSREGPNEAFNEGANDGGGGGGAYCSIGGGGASVSRRLGGGGGVSGLVIGSTGGAGSPIS